MASGVLSIDCQTCPVRDLHCGECMVPVLVELATHGGPAEVTEAALDPHERAAVTALVRSGLVSAHAAATARVQLERLRRLGVSEVAAG